MGVRLGVNIDHVATLRQVRGGTTPYPEIWEAAKAVVRGGADQITIHLREDRRHIQDTDLLTLAKKCKVDLNLEMAATEEMVRIALKAKPEIVCFVPEKRRELTTEGGLDVVKNFKKISDFTERLQRRGIEVSLFIDPTLEQVEASHYAGADAVELHTGTWVLAKGARRKYEFSRLKEACKLAEFLGLRVHAGHGLDLKTAPLAAKLPYMHELNIGHSIVCDALFCGLEKATRKIRKAMSQRKS